VGGRDGGAICIETDLYERFAIWNRVATWKKRKFFSLSVFHDCVDLLKRPAPPRPPQLSN
jgi:hypothetical protein